MQEPTEPGQRCSKLQPRSPSGIRLLESVCRVVLGITNCIIQKTKTTKGDQLAGRLTKAPCLEPLAPPELPESIQLNKNKQRTQPSSLSPQRIKEQWGFNMIPRAGKQYHTNASRAQGIPGRQSLCRCRRCLCCGQHDVWNTLRAGFKFRSWLYLSRGGLLRGAHGPLGIYLQSVGLK